MKHWHFGLLYTLLFNTALAAPLSHNPFRWPDLGQMPTSGADRTANVVANVVANELPTVRAVISGGGFTAANIDGTLVAEGEFYQGYQLVAVHEGHVVLQKNEQRYTVPVYSGDHSGNEQALSRSETNINAR